ncbi:MAG: hypothetical protein KDA93_18855 [Planctomycetaceae bacterium]|nr:hypothetical protein [Planctomycetaceae bacterium]
MRQFIETLFGIDAPSWTAGGTWRLEWLSLPDGDRMLLLLAGLLVAALGLWALYRWEGRHVHPAKRSLLWGVRLVVLALVVGMMLEPVLVLVKEEYAPSNLLVLVDSSQSMGLRDAWQDEAAANRAAEQLGIDGGQESLRKLTRLDLVSRILDPSMIAALEGEDERIVHIHRFADRMEEDAISAFGEQLDAESSANPKAMDETPSTINDQPSTFNPTGETTAIGSALKQALLAYAGTPVAGVLIISDGQSTSGEPVDAAAKVAADENVTVVTVAIGTVEGPRNATITSVESSPVAFVRDTNQVTVQVQSRGMQDVSGGLVVEMRRNGGPWQELGREDIILGLDGAQQSFTFDFSETRPSKLEFRATLEDLGPELSEDDNVGHSETRIVRQRLRVLFIAGSTFPEVQFMRNTFLRDRSIELSTWNMAADEEYEHPGDTPINRLPVTQEELDDYDCVLLYDPHPEKWPANFPELMINFVTKAGGGLVLMAGEMQTGGLFDRQHDPQLAWLDMLPVIREPGLFRSEVQLKLSARQPWKFVVTDQGMTDPVFAFSEDAEANRRILEQLPGMFWHFPVTRAKPGATVLAVHGDPRMRNEFGPEVLLATQLVGPGRTMFVAFDSTYRWRYLSEQFFEGFWARVVDRAGRNKRLGGSYPFRLSTARSTYKPGTTVKVLARFHDVDSIEPGLDVLHGEVERGDDEPIPLSLTPDEQPGVFSTSFPVNRPGTHFIRVWMGDETAGVSVRAATLPMEVELPNLEYENPGVDRTSLQILAAATGGESFNLTEVDQIPEAFKVGKIARQLEHREEIWDAPIIYASIFILLCIEWIVRKRNRLI